MNISKIVTYIPKVVKLVSESGILKTDTSVEANEEETSDVETNSEMNEEGTPDMEASVEKNDTENIENEEVVISEDMTEEQEEAFIRRQKDRFQSVSSIQNPKEVLDALKVFSEQANETIKFCEVQKTKRAEIRSAANVEIHRINKISDLIEKYLEDSFDERRFLFKQHFERIDKALEIGNSDVVAMELQCINQLSAQSPFKSLADVKKVLDNKDQKELDVL